MTQDQESRADIDSRTPQSARVYDYWLGGSSNFAADRAMAQAIEQAIPGIKAMARENRRFLGRSVRYMAEEAGIRQFLDVGSGIPADGDTHPGSCAPDRAASAFPSKRREAVPALRGRPLPPERCPETG